MREQDRGQNAIRLCWLPGPGQEGRDLADERVTLLVGGEPQRVVAGLLEVAGTGDVSGQMTAVVRSGDLVPEPLDDQRRYVDRGQHVAHVDLPDHREHPLERARAEADAWAGHGWPERALAVQVGGVAAACTGA